MLGLKFVGKSRILGLNATNRKVLNKIFGNIAKAWRGQEITLYVSETQMAGETVKCVRIRDQRARVATAAEEMLASDDDPKATPASSPASVDPSRVAFDKACTVAGLAGDQREEFLADHNGDLGRATKAAQELADNDTRELFGEAKS